jgi:hypothetical protein
MKPSMRYVWTYCFEQYFLYTFRYRVPRKKRSMYLKVKNRNNSGRQKSLCYSIHSAFYTLVTDKQKKSLIYVVTFMFLLQKKSLIYVVTFMFLFPQMICLFAVWKRYDYCNKYFLEPTYCFFFTFTYMVCFFSVPSTGIQIKILFKQFVQS